MASVTENIEFFCLFQKPSILPVLYFYVYDQVICAGAGLFFAGACLFLLAGAGSCSNNEMSEEKKCHPPLMFSIDHT